MWINKYLPMHGTMGIVWLLLSSRKESLIRFVISWFKRNISFLVLGILRSLSCLSLLYFPISHHRCLAPNLGFRNNVLTIYLALSPVHTTKSILSFHSLEIRSSAWYTSRGAASQSDVGAPQYPASFPLRSFFFRCFRGCLWQSDLMVAMYSKWWSIWRNT